MDLNSRVAAKNNYSNSESKAISLNQKFNVPFKKNLT